MYQHNRLWNRWDREAAFYDSAAEANPFAAALRRSTSRTSHAEERDSDDAGELTYEASGSIYFLSSDPYRGYAVKCDDCGHVLQYAVQWAYIGTGSATAHIGLPRMRSLSPLA